MKIFLPFVLVTLGHLTNQIGQATKWVNETTKRD